VLRRAEELVGEFSVEVVEDLSDDIGVNNESENFHPGPATRAVQRVDLVDAVDKFGPSPAQRTSGCRLDSLCPVRLDPGGVVGPVGCPNAVGVDAVEEDEVFHGLGNVDEDTGQELEGVDERVVVLDGLPALGLVQEEL
jgi:hypothetical protein